MSCQLKALITVFILSTMALHLNCRTFRRESSKLETIPLQWNKYELRSNGSASLHSNNEKHPLGNFHKKDFEVEAGFQGDAPAFGGPAISRNMYRSGSSSQSTDMWLSLPMVNCSKEVMTLTAIGREYTHLFIDRVNAAPLPLFQVPAYCRYSVKVTWKDLVLMAPYDGCYMKQENGSYVLSLQWWGSPIKISCPMTTVTSQPTPSVLCTQFGMVIAIEGAQEAAEKHRVKVNGNILPLLSETCAYRVHSPPEVVLLHTALRSECVTATDGESILTVILDGKQFTLTCPFPYHLSRFLPYHHSRPFPKPLQPYQNQVSLIPHVPAFPAVLGTIRRPTTPKPAVIPYLPYELPAVPQLPHTSHDTRPIHQIPNVYQLQKPPARIYHHPAPPVETPPEPSLQQHLPLPLPVDQIPVSQYPVMHPPQYALYPISCPPYHESFCSKYHHPPYHQPAMTTASQPSVQPMPWIPFPQPTYKPLIQETLFPQIPVFPPTPPVEPPKRSPSLVCTKNQLMATFPSTTMDSIKVKDVKKNTWISITSVPVACNYKIHSRGGSVELSSPLPSCHTHKMSATVISLNVRFWDSSQLRFRTLQLQCHHVEDRGTQPTVPLLKPLHQIVPHFTTVRIPAQPPPKFQVVCSSQNMSVTLPPGPTSGIIVQATSSGIKTEAVPILEAPSHCGYSVRRGKDGAIHVLLPFSSCHMTHKDGQHRIIFKYQTLTGRTVESLLSCQATFSQECDVAPEQRLVCGSAALSSLECHERGCCYCVDTQSCYYPMDECTMDRHFVFSVHSSVADPPFSPATLVTAGNSPCTPHKVTADSALFKIPLDECGVHRYVSRLVAEAENSQRAYKMCNGVKTAAQRPATSSTVLMPVLNCSSSYDENNQEVGKTVIYMVEVLNRVEPISLNYGTITRESPVRLLVECRYLPGSVVSVGYLVKSPSLGPSIKAQGVFGVQLRIAKDEHYSSFYPQYHQPLQMLLGKPLYLEVRLLNPPDPTAMLLVHYCVAYPRSAQSAWILIYDGCPNFLDQTPTHMPPATPAEALTNHVRRFTITTFQFLSEDDNLLADQEIYFMCSTEVCLPSDGPCVEGCFADPSVKF